MADYLYRSVSELNKQGTTKRVCYIKEEVFVGNCLVLKRLKKLFPNIEVFVKFLQKLP